MSYRFLNYFLPFSNLCLPESPNVFRRLMTVDFSGIGRLATGRFVSYVDFSSVGFASGMVAAVRCRFYSKRVPWHHFRRGVAPAIDPG